MSTTGAKITASLYVIRRYWPDMLPALGSAGNGPKVSTVPSSSTPIPLDLLSLRRQVVDDLASWATLTKALRSMTSSVNRRDVYSTSDFLLIHADWIGEQKFGRAVDKTLDDDATKCQEYALGTRTRRFALGNCIEQVDVDGLLEPCPGRLHAYLRDSDALLPSVLSCDHELSHKWAPHEWDSLGRRLLKLNPEAMERLRKRIRFDVS